jgi:hypothetical protein
VSPTWNNVPQKMLAGNVDDFAVHQEAGGMCKVLHGDALAGKASR